MTTEQPVVTTITCPECEEVWPTISEQAVVYDKTGICYSCFIQSVVQVRDQLIADADYTVDNCPDCIGSALARATCIPCGGKGWQVAAKDTVKLIAVK